LNILLFLHTTVCLLPIADVVTHSQTLIVVIAASISIGMGLQNVMNAQHGSAQACANLKRAIEDYNAAAKDLVAAGGTISNYDIMQHQHAIDTYNKGCK
jgi:hypothetical protein